MPNIIYQIDLTSNEIYRFMEIIWNNVIIFKWRQNDILILDNIHTGHGRMNVIPPRKIIVAMGN